MLNACDKKFQKRLKSARRVNIKKYNSVFPWRCLALTLRRNRKQRAWDGGRRGEIDEGLSGRELSAQHTAVWLIHVPPPGQSAHNTVPHAQSHRHTDPQHSNTRSHIHTTCHTSTAIFHSRRYAHTHIFTCKHTRTHTRTRHVHTHTHARTPHTEARTQTTKTQKHAQTFTQAEIGRSH